MSRLLIYLLTLLLSVIAQGWASTPVFASTDHTVVLGSEGERYFIGEHLRVLKGFENDSLIGTMSLPASSWRPVTSSSVVIGYTSTPHWFHVAIDPRDAHHAWYLHLDWSQLDYVDVYFTDADGRLVSAWFSGDKLPFSRRPVDHPQFVYPIPAFDEVLHAWIRVRTDSLFYFTPQVWSEIEAHPDGQYYLLGASRTEFWQSLFFGLMLTMTVYNLFVYFVSRDGAYLAYAAYCVTFVLYQASLQGMGYKYLWGSSELISDKSNMVFAFLSYAAATVFIRRFLRLKENGHHRLDLAGRVVFWLWCVSACLALMFRESVVVAATAPLAIVTCIMGIGVPLYCWRRNDVFGLYFLLAWSFLVLGTASYLFLQIGVFDANWFTLLGGQQIGAAIETIVISLALSHRMKVLKENTLSSQERLLSYVQKYSQVLNDKMSRRIAEIHEAREKLLAAQQQLSDREKISSLDMLAKGIHQELTVPRERLTGDLNAISEGTIELAHHVNDLVRGEQDEELSKVLQDAIDDLIKPMEMISSGHFRIAILLQQLRAARNFAKGEKTAVDLSEILQRVIARVMPQFPGVKYTWRERDELRIAGWPMALEEAVMQLLRNACQASEAASADREPYVVIRIEKSDGHVDLLFEDTGHGIDPSVQLRIFDPFFTTRAVGQGMGLGLTMTRDLIERHDGAVECVDTGTHGTTLRVRLPL